MINGFLKNQRSSSKLTCKQNKYSDELKAITGILTIRRSLTRPFPAATQKRLVVALAIERTRDRSSSCDSLKLYFILSFNKTFFIHFNLNNSEHFLISGDVLLFEIFNQEEENVEFRLSDFHKKIKNPLNNKEELLLVGIIRYIDMIISARTRYRIVSGEDISQGTNGHYTTIVYRRGNTSWVEFDDCQPKQIPRSHNFKVVPRLLMYIKESK